MNNTLTGPDTSAHTEMVRLIAEHMSCSEEEVRPFFERELHNPGVLVAEAWRRADPKSPEEIKRFYEVTDAYIYDLAADHSRQRRRDVWEVIFARCWRRGGGLTVLMYGDGIGSDSISLAQAGFRVSYFDVPGRTAEFARFRFRKEGLDGAIQVLHDPAAIEPNHYDIVISIEVLEHLPDPLSHLELLYAALRDGGIALITESFGTVGDDYPSHLPSNLRYAGKTHHCMEALGFANSWYNADPVNYPMEFVKVRPGLPGLVYKQYRRAARAVDSRFRALRGRRR